MTTSTAALVPALSSLDERVLAAVAEPATARDVAGRVHGWPGWTCDGCGYVQRRSRRKWDGMGVLRPCGRRLDPPAPDDSGEWPPPGGKWCAGRWQPGALLSDGQAREVLEILHGLERVGRAHEVDGVWHRGPRP